MQPRFGSTGNFYATPALAYGRVYVGATDGKVYSFGASSGKLRWSQSTGGYVYSSAAVWRSRCTSAPTRTRSSASTRRPANVLWKFKANGPISGSPTIVAGRVYFATLAGHDLRARREERSALLDVPGRQVLTGRRRCEAPLPRRLRASLRARRDAGEDAAHAEHDLGAARVAEGRPAQRTGRRDEAAHDRGRSRTAGRAPRRRRARLSHRGARQQGERPLGGRSAPAGLPVGFRGALCRHRGGRVHRLPPHRVAARRGPRRRRSRLLHRLLRPGVEGGERARARRAADRSGRGRARLRRFRRCLPPRGPAGRAQLRRRLPALPAAQRARDAACLRGCRRRRREGRLGELLVGVRRCGAVPDARGGRAAAEQSRTGSRSSPASSCTTPMRASSGFARLRCGTSRSTARGSAPTWRSHASSLRSRPTSRSSSTATARSRARSPTSPTSSRRRRSHSRHAPGIYNVGGGEEATMSDALSLLESVAGARPAGDVRPAADGRHAADEGRHEQDRARARLAGRHAASRRSLEALAVGGTR